METQGGAKGGVNGGAKGGAIRLYKQIIIPFLP